MSSIFDRHPRTKPLLAAIAANMLSVALLYNPTTAQITDSGNVFATPGANLVVGGNADGTRTVDGVADATYGRILIGNGFSAPGVPTATQPTGTLTVTNGGSVTAAPFGAGAPPTEGLIIVGNNGIGALNISAGGVVTGTTGLVAGSGPGSLACSGQPCSPPLGVSSGAVNVSGAGSQWNLSTLFVGQRGNGTLTISGGGQVITSGALVSGSTTQNSFIGNISGASGTVTVSGAGSKLDTANQLIIGNGFRGTEGNFGATTGVLNILSGGLVRSSASTVGNNAENLASSPPTARGVGTVNVSGAGSKWDISGPLSPGSTRNFLTVGRAGEGTLNVTGGGQVVLDGGPTLGGNKGAAFSLGLTAGSTGRVTVLGAGSRVEVKGPSDTGTTEIVDGVEVSFGVGGSVGFNGNGTFNVLNGGQIVLRGTSVSTLQPQGFLNVARNPGSTGTLLVSGAGSTLDVASIIRIGRFFNFDTGMDENGGTGLVTVSNGGTIQASELRIGGTSTLTGNGGTIIGNVFIESGGIFSPGSSPGTFSILGDLTVLPGGVLRLEIGADGTSDLLTVTGDLTVDAIDLVIDPDLDLTLGEEFTLIQGVGGDPLLELLVTATGFEIDSPLGDALEGAVTIVREDVGQQVPVPGTLILLAAGVLGGLARFARRGHPRS